MNSTDKDGVRQMFDAIAWRYDFLNHFLSLGIDRWWRKKAIERLSAPDGGVFLDVAAGTADLTLGLLKRKKPKKVVGIDISEQMLAIGRKKIEKYGYSNSAELINENCENLSFHNDTFDGVTVGFGIRNFCHPQKGLSEMHRVLKPGGELIVLEFSRPNNKVMSLLFDFYFDTAMPFWGRLFAKNRGAYLYLPESIRRFACGETFAGWMRDAGFSEVSFRTLTFGVVTIYKGTKA